MPPFRLFLLASVVFILVVFAVLEQQAWLQKFRLQTGNQLNGNFIIGGGALFNPGNSDAVEALKRSLRIRTCHVPDARTQRRR